MSEQWDSYFSRVNDAPASLAVDLGICENAAQLNRPWLLWVWVYLKDPRPDGLSDSTEAPVLWEIEDSIASALTPAVDSCLVGRITTSGRREFYFYARSEEGFESVLKSTMLQFPLYQYDYGAQSDPEWNQYFSVLYPSPRDLQRIKNRHVLDTLTEHGDSLAKARAVYHWVYFQTADNRQAFVERIQQRGFKIEGMSEPDHVRDRRYGLSISRDEKVDQNSIDKVTLHLFELANEMDAEYDGWETSVEFETNE